MSAGLIVGTIILFIFIVWAVLARLVIAGAKRFESLKNQTLARALAAHAEILSIRQAGGEVDVVSGLIFYLKNYFRFKGR